MNRMFLINGSLIANLNEATKKIQTDPDLEPDDMELVEALIKRLDSAARNRKTFLNYSKQSSAKDANNLLEKPESPKQPAGKAAVAIKISQAAKHLGISPNKLRELSDLGEVPCKKLNRERYFSIEDLNQWIASLPPWVENNEIKENSR